MTANSSLLPLRLLLLRGLVVAVVAILVNLVILWALVHVAQVVEGGGPLTPPPVVGATLIATIAVTVSYGAVTRLWPDPDWLFIRLAAVALVLSGLPVLLVVREDPAIGAQAGIFLFGLHVTTAIVCLGGLTDRFSPIFPRKG